LGTKKGEPKMPVDSLILDADSLAQLSEKDLEAFKQFQPGATVQIAKPVAPARGPDDPADLDFESVNQLPAEDLAAFATETKWSPYGWAQSNPDKLDDSTLTKLANTDLILRKQGWKLSDIPIKTVLTAIPTLVAGMGTHLGKSLTAAISPVVEATGYLPEGEAMKVGAKAAGEMLAGTEAAATGFADLFRKGFEKFGRFIGAAKSLDEYTDEDAVSLFSKELSIRNQLGNIIQGEGEATKFLGGQTLRDLKASGVKLDPAEIEKASHGDPFTFAAFTGGFKILNGATGKVVGFAANRSGAINTVRKLQALKGAEKSAEKLVEAIPSAENITAANRATIALGTEQAGAPLLSKAVDLGERAIEALPTATGVIGKTTQFLGWGTENIAKGANFLIPGLKSLLIGKPVQALGRVTKEFGKNLAIPEAAGGTWMRAVQDVIKAPGQVAAGMAKGFPIDMGLLAVSAETPEEARESPFLGTAFGGVGGLLRAGRGFIQGQQIAPRPWGSSNSWQKSYGNFPELDAAHAETMRIASPGIKQRIGALRDLADTTGAELYQFTGAESLAKFLEAQGWDAATARDYAAANGITLGPLIDKNGGARKVILVRDPISAPHEVGHPIMDTLTPEHKDVLLDKVLEHYGDEQVLQRAQQESSALATTSEAKAEAGLNWQNFLLRITGDGPAAAKAKVETNPELAGNPWDLILTEAEKSNLVKRYASNEILADTVDTVLRHGTPELLQDAKFPGFVSRVLSRLMVLTGADPYAEVTAVSPFETPMKAPVVEAVRAAVEPFAEAISTRKPPVIEPSQRPPRVAPTPGGIPVTPEAQKSAADEAREIADSAPAEPTITGQRSTKELLGELADAIAQRVGVKLNYLSAPDEPAAAITSNRKTRRELIEIFRSMPAEARSLWEKNFFPERVLRTSGGTLQVLGWAPEVFAANAHKVAQSIAAKPELSPYPIDNQTKTFTTEGWKQLYEDTKTFVENQMGGRTGAGDPLVVPSEITEKNFFSPKVEGQAVPLDQGKADFINLLFGIPLPKTPRITGGKLPLSIVGQEVSKATLPGRISVPVEPKAPFAGPAAEQLGIAGREILEVNPARAAIEQAGIKLPGLLEAVQRLNAENIKEVAIAPEQPQFRGNVLTLTAGFQPWVREGELTPGKRKIEIEGPDGKRYPAIFDGYQDMTPMDMGFVAQITPNKGLPFQGDAKRSTTYLPRLEEEGYKVITELPTPEQWESERAAGRKGMFQPNSDVQKIADEFTGKKLPHGIKPPVVNTNLARRLADYYENTKHDPADKAVRASYDAFRAETLDQLKSIEEAGYTIEPWAGQGEPYKNSAEMVADVANNKHLWFNPTDKNFSAAKGGDNLMLEPVNMGERQVPINDVFRAVHDFFGHAGEGYQFGPRGELSAWNAHSEMYSPEAQGALAAETLAQNSWVNFGKHLEGKTVPQAERPFAEQKNIVVPNYLIAEAKATFNPMAQFQPKLKEPRAIKMAAVRDSVGKIFTGRHHIEATEAAEKSARSEPNAQKNADGELVLEDGFITNSGEFLNREDAFTRALSLNQVDTKKLDAGGIPAEQSGIESFEFAAARKFQPKKAKQDELKFDPTSFGQASKAWILPNGKVEQLGSMWHHHWLDENKAIQEKYGIKVPPFEGGDAEGVREAALKKGFSRVNLINGTLTVEARVKDWKNLRPIVEDLIERNIDDVDKFRVNLLDDGINKIKKSFSENIFDLDTNKEKMAKVYEAFSEQPQTEIGAQFQPRAEQEQLFGGRELLSTREISTMSRKELQDHFPEAIVPRKLDEKIPSEIIQSPLYKKAGSEDAAVEAFSDKLVEFTEQQKDNPAFKAGLNWYSEFVPMLKKTFGKYARRMAELLASTSPQTNVETNFAYALDALEGWKSGRFDKIISKFNEGMDKLNDGSWENWYSKEVKKEQVADVPETSTPASFMKHWIEKYNLKPTQSNGKLYGQHSIPVLQVFARRWLELNKGPKVSNFVLNLLGEGHEATIDLWADRTMRRVGYEGAEGRWRILPQNVTGVSDVDFAFSQKAFRAAAEKIGVKPDALQGGLWFAEKQHWADNGWGRLDLGDFRKEIQKAGLLKAGIKRRLSITEAGKKIKPAEEQELKVEPR
jgi:hypothetical protein